MGDLECFLQVNHTSQRTQSDACVLLRLRQAGRLMVAYQDPVIGRVTFENLLRVDVSLSRTEANSHTTSGREVFVIVRPGSLFG